MVTPVAVAPIYLLTSKYPLLTVTRPAGPGLYTFISILISLTSITNIFTTISHHQPPNRCPVSYVLHDHFYWYTCMNSYRTVASRMVIDRYTGGEGMSMVTVGMLADGWLHGIHIHYSYYYYL